MADLRLGHVVPALVVALFASTTALQESAEEERADRSAIAAQRERFLDAWLEQDQETVMACFVDDAVLVPHAGVPAVATKERIRAFYFSGPPSTIFEFGMKPSAELVVDGANAHEYGRYTLVYELEGDVEPTSVEGNYVSIWRRGEDGVWRYALRTWNHA
jgi:ketosteroid isomerase-like protein